MPRHNHWLTKYQYVGKPASRRCEIVSAHSLPRACAAVSKRCSPRKVEFFLVSYIPPEKYEKLMKMKDVDAMAIIANAAMAINYYLAEDSR